MNNENEFHLFLKEEVWRLVALAMNYFYRPSERGKGMQLPFELWFEERTGPEDSQKEEEGSHDSNSTSIRWRAG